MTLTPPKSQPETVTATGRKPRSQKQQAWSRELGKRSQEFKKKKSQRLDPPAAKLETEEVAPPPTKTSSTPSLYYLGGLAGGGVILFFVYRYYFGGKPDKLKTLPAQKPKENVSNNPPQYRPKTLPQME